jgi:dihydroxyacetone kinase-like protein
VVSGVTTLAADDLKAIFARVAEVMAERKEELTELDGVIGDGDLGLTMSKGFRAVADALTPFEETDPGKLFGRAGMVLAAAVPSTMGTLLATGFLRASKAVAGQREVAVADLARFWGEFVAALLVRGKAKVGEKTILDALHPAAETLTAAASEGQPLAEALAAAARAAWAGVEATRGMISQHGKAACFQEKTLGHRDPGAVVGALLIQAFAEHVA